MVSAQKPFARILWCRVADTRRETLRRSHSHVSSSSTRTRIDSLGWADNAAHRLGRVACERPLRCIGGLYKPKGPASSERTGVSEVAAERSRKSIEPHRDTPARPRRPRRVRSPDNASPNSDAPSWLGVRGSRRLPSGARHAARSASAARVRSATSFRSRSGQHPLAPAHNRRRGTGQRRAPPGRLPCCERSAHTPGTPSVVPARR